MLAPREQLKWDADRLRATNLRDVLGHACGKLAPHLLGSGIVLLQPVGEFSHPHSIWSRARLGNTKLGVRRRQGMLAIGEQFFVQFFARPKTYEFDADVPLAVPGSRAGCRLGSGSVESDRAGTPNARNQAVTAARILWTSAAAERGLNRVILFVGPMGGPLSIHQYCERQINCRPDAQQQLLHEGRRR